VRRSDFILSVRIAGYMGWIWHHARCIQY